MDTYEFGVALAVAHIATRLGRPQRSAATRSTRHSPDRGRSAAAHQISTVVFHFA
jgi:hypothetical protein